LVESLELRIKNTSNGAKKESAGVVVVVVSTVIKNN
jgi:hypothetical protein